MRLYLSSFRLGHPVDRLLRITGPRSAIGVVCNGIDDRPAADRDLASRREFADLASIGLRPEEIDLRAPRSLDRLAEIGAVWVRGGNTFLLAAALAASGAGEIVRERVRRGSLAYAGYSAAGAVLAPDLSPIAAVDDPAVAGVAAQTAGIGLLDRAFVPHVDSPQHPESEACTAVSRALTEAGTPHWAVRDGEALCCDDTEELAIISRPG